VEEDTGSRTQVFPSEAYFAQATNSVFVAELINNERRQLS